MTQKLVRQAGVILNPASPDVNDAIRAAQKPGKHPAQVYADLMMAALLAAAGLGMRDDDISASANDVLAIARRAIEQERALRAAVTPGETP